jgi:hypothetical protein
MVLESPLLKRFSSALGMARTSKKLVLKSVHRRKKGLGLKALELMTLAAQYRALKMR